MSFGAPLRLEQLKAALARRARDYSPKREAAVGKPWSRQKAVGVALSIDVEADDLAAVVDPVERRTAGRGRIRIIQPGDRVGEAIVDDAVIDPVDDVESHRHAEIVDSEELGCARAGPVDGREVAVDVEETVSDVAGIGVKAGDLAEIVDCRRNCADCMRIVDVDGKLAGVDVVGVAVAVACCVVVKSDGDIEVVDPQQLVFDLGETPGSTTVGVCGLLTGWKMPSFS